MTPKNLLKVERNILPKIELVQTKIDSKILPTVEKKPILMDDAKYKDFADRLNALMKAKDSPIKTINELKNAIGVSYEMARRYTLGSAKPRIEKLQTLADIFGVEISYLDHGTKLDNNIDLSDKVGFEGRRVPVISWVAAGSFTPIETVLKDTEIEEYLPPNKRCGKNGYALKVVGYSMAPTFLPGDRIYVNPDIQTFDLKTDDLVIVACAGDSEATFKKLIIEGEGTSKFLEPLNPDWPDKIIKLSEDCRLVGKVVGLYRDIY
ncbi:helix-turn-helix domain-containing protein [Acinetobacter baumannii]